MDGQREFARLMKSPSVQSRKGTPFTLTGGVIDLYSRNKSLERVVATPTGHVLSRDLELAADSVDLRVKDNQLQRVIAWGRTSRATALTPERRILADSIDALMPNQRIREVRAIGSAFANSAPDSARIVSTERDWMRGDSVIAEFDSIAPGDTTTKPQAKRIVAKGNASSFYQMAGSGSVKARPNLNYVRGRVITVSFVNRTVDRVDVLDKASGLFLEPSSDSTAARGTTTRSNSSTPPAPPPPPTSRKQKP
jgi:hypothetical protein